MELWLEVMHAEELPVPENPFHDLTCSGPKGLRPFVQVTFQSQSRQSKSVPSRGGVASFGWKAHFNITGEDRECRFCIYDKKGKVRGPLIGEAVLPLLELVPSNGLLTTFTLRNGRASTGRLTVLYELVQGRGESFVGNAFGDVVCGALGGELTPCRTPPACAQISFPQQENFLPRGPNLAMPQQGAGGQQQNICQSGACLRAFSPAKSDSSAASFCSARENEDDSPSRP